MDHGREGQVGRLIGGFHIEGVLGRGGMGVVYRATEVRLGRAVALKVIRPSLTDDPTFRARFERESAHAAAIDHPHVLPVYESGEDEGELFIAMRLVEGCDLAELLRHTGPFEAFRAVRLAGQVAAALDAAHGAGLVHRDVKPANVLVAGVGDDEHAFLSDFGLTKRSSSQSGVTGTGQWLGTLNYVAPEQIRGDPVDARADVYALGCVLYELLTGRKPFGRESDVATMWAHISDPPPAPSAVDPRLPVELDRVFARALAKDPLDRFPTAGELVAAATSALTDTTGAPNSDPVPLRRATYSPHLGAVFGLASAAITLVQSYVQITFEYRPPGVNATGSELVEFYTATGTTELIEDSVSAIAFTLLIGFVWSLPRMVSGATPVPKLLVAAVRTTGFGAVAAQLAAMFCAAAPTFELAVIGDTGILQGLWTAYIRLSAAGICLLGLSAAGAALIAFRSRGVRSPTAWLCLVVAGASIAGTFAELSRDESARFAVYAVHCLWITGIAVNYLAKASSTDRIDSFTRRQRIVAAGGLGPAIAFTATGMIPAATARDALSESPTASEFATFFQQAGWYVATYSAIYALGFILATGLAWTLYRVLAEAQPWALVGVGATAAVAILTILSRTLYFLQTMIFSLATSTSTGALSFFAEELSFVLAALAVTCFGVAILRTRQLPIWLTWTGSGVSVLLLVSSIAELTITNPRSIPVLHDAAWALYMVWSGAAAIAIMCAPQLLASLRTPIRA